MDIKNLKMVTYEAAVPPRLIEPKPKEPFRRVAWTRVEEGLKTSIDANNASNIVVLHGSSGIYSSAIAEALGAATFHIAAAGSLDKFNQIVIDDCDGSVLAAATENSWASLQEVLLQSSQPILWLTRGANEGESVSSGIPQGFLRAVRSEMATAKISIIDADKGAPLEQIASLVQHQLVALQAQSENLNSEFWLTADSDVLVPQFETNENLNQLFYKEQDYTTNTISADRSYESKIIDNELVWKIQSAEASVTPDLLPLEVEIQVRFVEFSKDDLSPRAQNRAQIVTGNIVRIGRGLNIDLVGRAVAAYSTKTSLKSFKTRLITSAFNQLKDQDSASLVSAAAILPQLSRAVRSLALNSGAKETLCQLSGQRVVLLPGAATPFEDIVEKLSGHLGFHASKAVEDYDELQRLLRSANVVIADAPSGLVPDVWRSMPDNSTFVFGSDVPVDIGPLDSKPFARGVTLRTCGNDAAALKQTLETSVDLLHCFDDLQQPAIVVVDVGQLAGDLDIVRSIIAEMEGTKVLKIGYGESEVKVSLSEVVVMIAC